MADLQVFSSFPQALQDLLDDGVIFLGVVPLLVGRHTNAYHLQQWLESGTVLQGGEEET